MIDEPKNLDQKSTTDLYIAYDGEDQDGNQHLEQIHT